jgi:hypothetical protein
MSKLAGKVARPGLAEVRVAEPYRQGENLLCDSTMWVRDARTYSAATFIVQTRDVFRAAISSNCCKARSKSFRKPRQA